MTDLPDSLLETPACRGGTDGHPLRSAAGGASLRGAVVPRRVLLALVVLGAGLAPDRSLSRARRQEPRLLPRPHRRALPGRGRGPGAPHARSGRRDRPPLWRRTLDGEPARRDADSDLELASAAALAGIAHGALRRRGRADADPLRVPALRRRPFQSRARPLPTLP